MKIIQVEKKENSLFSDYILYIENLKVAIRKLLRLINKLCKVACYKISIQKPVAINAQKNKLRKSTHLQLHQRQ